ncbi:hypothetical protein ACFL3N_01655 [Candidatus Omnitrophota bacterium]
MVTVRVVAIGIVMALIASLPLEALAETRTLTTQIIVTVRPDEPDLTGAPQGIREACSNAFPQDSRQRFVRKETQEETGLGNPRYTVVEKL